MEESSVFPEALPAPGSVSLSSTRSIEGSSDHTSPHSLSFGRIPSLSDARKSRAFQSISSTTSFREDPSKPRSMSVVANPKFDAIERMEREKRHASGYLRSNSLHTTGHNPPNRPAIPTGNMLTESLMAAAAERKRKKSVAASIRNIVKAEQRQLDLPFYTLALVLLVVSGLLIVMTVLWINALQDCDHWMIHGNSTHAEPTQNLTRPLEDNRDG